jgi:DNA polymerase III epsilon subunit-like protein
MRPKWLVADVETTGLDTTVDKVTEVAWVELDDDLGYVPGTEFHSLVNPQRKTSCAAGGLSGIRDSLIEAENPPTIDEIDFPKEGVVLITHNVKFDIEFLKPHLNVVDSMCTLVLARRLIPGSDDYKLSTLSCHLDLPYQLSHRAMGDVWDCGNLLVYMCEALDWTLNQMLDYYKKPVILDYCRVGRKWNGELWKNVDKGYLAWILREDFDEDTKRAARYWLGRK